MKLKSILAAGTAAALLVGMLVLPAAPPRSLPSRR